jgi:ATP-binding cassette, subfamily C (CFTR/MRP), member 1
MDRVEDKQIVVDGRPIRNRNEEKVGLKIDWQRQNGIVYKIFFAQVTKLISTGAIRRLEIEDLCHLEQMGSELLWEKFERNWESEKKRASLMSSENKKNNKANLIKCLLREHHFTFAWTGVLFGISQAAVFAGPLLLREIVKGIQCRTLFPDTCETSVNDLYFFCGLLTVASVISNFCSAHQEFALQKVGVQVRNTLMVALYRKVLRLSPKGLQAESTGKIVTLMSNDVNKLQDLFAMIHNLWAAPIFIVASFTLLYDVIEWSAFVGFACIFIAAPFTFTVAKKLFALRRLVVQCADRRVNILSEVVSGMKVIKYYAWEKTFKEKTEVIRDEEVKLVWRAQKISALFGVALFSTPIFIAVCSFGSFSLAGNAITAPTAYTALALFNTLRFPLILVPFLLTTLLNALNAIQRLGAFLDQDETIDLEMDQGDPGRVVLTDASFCWPTLPKKNLLVEDAKGGVAQQQQQQPKAATETKDDSGPIKTKSKRIGKKEQKRIDDEKLAKENEAQANEPQQEPFGMSNVSVNIAPGTLTMIIGPVGSGKSTLLSALNKFITLKSGEIKLSGTSSFCAQQAWILNTSVRDNILFGKEFSQTLYDDTLKKAQLEDDLDLLPAGDMTMIGERGVTLSGGQKQRVSIARALYAESDVYLFDDPLSAVDNHVGAALFQEVIQGSLAKKTRVLVTNALQYLPKADQIVVLEDGKVHEIGTYKSLMAKGLDFSKLMKNHGLDGEDDSNDKRKSIDGAAAAAKSIEGAKNDDDDEKKVAVNSEAPAAQAIPKKKIITDDMMGKEEERSTGNVSLKVYMEFFKATGTKFSALFVFLLFACEYGTKAFLDFWLSWWAENKFGWDSKQYLGIYFTIFLVNGISIFFRSIVFYYFCVRAAKNLHNKLLSQVLKMPMSFFDTTPSGRIINRFSRDTETIDSVLPGIVVQFLGCISNIITTLAIICAATVWFTIALPPVFLIYISVQRFYIPACRELQRIESITRSPIYSGLGEAVLGVETIRAYRAQKYFIFEADMRAQKNADAFISQRMAACWLNMRLRFIGTGIVLLASFLVIQGKVEAGIAGLTLVYALDVTKYMEHGTNMASQLETQMNAVERIVQYLDLPLEKSHETTDEETRKQIFSNDVDSDQKQQWPAEGKLEIIDLSMRYRENLPLVLNKISFTVLPGEKIGICGRTGSGKSSMFVALFRIVEPEQGTRVILDGIDISKLGLRDLRSKMAMIPQDPFMFAGTIRTNLDPFEEHKDEEVWSVIEKVGLKQTIDQSLKKLDMEVIDNGANFSLGQRQLLCMGRALLRNSKVLMMDEATASVDMDSDALIQKTVREAFSSCTTLTIAHRLNTIMDSDKILFLDQGKVSEFDDPQTLLMNKNGYFSKLVEKSGKNQAKNLQRIASEQALIRSETKYFNK